MVTRSVIRIAILLCVYLIVPAFAQSQFNSGYDIDLLTKVEAEAIDFILPRTLEPVSAAQLAVWGLNGLASIDPTISVTTKDGSLRLMMGGRTTLDIPLPPSDPISWAEASGRVVAAAYLNSTPLRQASPQTVTKVLFDQMLAHLDPWSRYVPPIEAFGDRDRRVGHAGIGVTLTQRGRQVVVRNVIIASPGAQAGVVPGDIIQWVDGRTVAGRDHTIAAAMMNGPEGTDLRIGWLSIDGSTRGATLTRVLIPPETVFPRRLGNVLVIQITGFSQTTDRNVDVVVRNGLRSGRPISGIVLDLRGNRGGVLRAAVATADIFLPGGVVVRSSGRAPDANRVWPSLDGELAQGVRMTVLVDGGTASAAEVLAAALADRGRAVVIGSSTFGKGVVQTIDALPDGGELFLTWSRLLAPRGWPIQSLGVLPQICTSQGNEALRRQLAALAAGYAEMAPALQAHRGARAPVTPDQIVAIRGQCPAADPRETDLAVAVALVENAASHSAALLSIMPDER